MTRTQCSRHAFLTRFIVRDMLAWLELSVAGMHAWLEFIVPGMHAWLELSVPGIHAWLEFIVPGMHVGQEFIVPGMHVTCCSRLFKHCCMCLLFISVHSWSEVSVFLFVTRCCTLKAAVFKIMNSSQLYSACVCTDIVEVSVFIYNDSYRYTYLTRVRFTSSDRYMQVWRLAKLLRKRWLLVSVN